MRKRGILMLAAVLISFGIAFATIKQGIRLAPNHSYEVTLLVRSCDLAKSGILGKENIKINVEKTWKVESVSGEKDLWRLTGKFTLPYSLGGTPIPEGVGAFVVDEVNIETIDGKKAN